MSSATNFNPTGHTNNRGLSAPESVKDLEFEDATLDAKIQEAVSPFFITTEFSDIQSCFDLPIDQKKKLYAHLHSLNQTYFNAPFDVQTVVNCGVEKMLQQIRQEKKFTSQMSGLVDHEFLSLVMDDMCQQLVAQIRAYNGKCFDEILSWNFHRKKGLYLFSQKLQQGEPLNQEGSEVFLKMTTSFLEFDLSLERDCKSEIKKWGQEFLELYPPDQYPILWDDRPSDFEELLNSLDRNQLYYLGHLLSTLRDMDEYEGEDQVVLHLDLMLRLAHENPTFRTCLCFEIGQRVVIMNHPESLPSYFSQALLAWCGSIFNTEMDIALQKFLKIVPSAHDKDCFDTILSWPLPRKKELYDRLVELHAKPFVLGESLKCRLEALISSVETALAQDRP